MNNIDTNDVKNIVDFIKIHTYINGDEPITDNTLNNYENDYVFDNFKQMYGGECADKIDDIRIMYVDYMEGGKGKARKAVGKAGKAVGKAGVTVGKSVGKSAGKAGVAVGKSIKKKSKKEMCKMCENLNCP